LRDSLFWDVMRSRLIVTDVSGLPNAPIFKEKQLKMGQIVYSGMSVNIFTAILHKVQQEQGISFTPWRKPEINFGSCLPPNNLYFSRKQTGPLYSLFAAN